MKKSKYSFKANQFEFSIKRVLEESSGTSKIIIISNRSKDRKIALIRGDVLTNFVGLGAANIATDDNGYNWYVVAKQESVQEVIEFVEHETARMWFDVYTWK